MMKGNITERRSANRGAQGRAFGRVPVRMLSAVLCLALVLLAALPLAATSGNGRVQPLAGKYPDKLPNSGGAWVDNDQIRPAPVGNQEAVCFPLKLGADVVDGESIQLDISALSLNLQSAQLVLVHDNSGSIFARELDFTLSPGGGADGADLLRCLITVDSAWRGAEVSLLLMAPRVSDGGTVNLQLSSQPLAAMESGQTLHVDDYSITKQAGAGLTMPIGMSGVANASSAYVIRKDGAEKLRVVMDGNLVLGLAIREAGLVVGLDFDVSQKVYISSLTQKTICSRADMQSIFNDLDFSFVRPPAEQSWLARQDNYSYSRSFDFM